MKAQNLPQQIRKLYTLSEFMHELANKTTHIARNKDKPLLSFIARERLKIPSHVDIRKLRLLPDRPSPSKRALTLIVRESDEKQFGNVQEARKTCFFIEINEGGAFRQYYVCVSCTGVAPEYGPPHCYVTWDPLGAN